MTALDFILHDNGVILAMDTLALSKENRKPFKMVTKFFPIPHMNCLICGTGNMNVILDWFIFIEKNIIANGIYQLNKLTTECIGEFMKEHNGDNSCSIYQFGLHELDDKFHGYVYRSINGFVSEEINQGIAVKPSDALYMSKDSFQINNYEYFDDYEDIHIKIIEGMEHLNNNK